MVVITLATRTAPRGVRDSKLLTPAAREELVPRVRRWATAYAVGHASAAEIDAEGIVPALRLAGQRALGALSVRPDVVLLDGNHDYLTPPGARPAPEPTLFDVADVTDRAVPRVVTAVKGDMRCSGIAAASILAKTERDALMGDLSTRHPGYGWETNRGYASPDHVAALAALGPCAEHRRSWRLPGVAVATVGDERVAPLPEPSGV